jgi:hypothetical protein
MVDLLGKRTVRQQGRRNGKWLDENMGKGKSAPPPLEGVVEDIPAPAVSKAIDVDVFRPRV